MPKNDFHCSCMIMYDQIRLDQIRMKKKMMNETNDNNDDDDNEISSYE